MEKINRFTIADQRMYKYAESATLDNDNVYLTECGPYNAVYTVVAKDTEYVNLNEHVKNGKLTAAFMLSHPDEHISINRAQVTEALWPLNRDPAHWNDMVQAVKRVHQKHGYNPVGVVQYLHEMKDQAKQLMHQRIREKVSLFDRQVHGHGHGNFNYRSNMQSSSIRQEPVLRSRADVQQQGDAHRQHGGRAQQPAQDSHQHGHAQRVQGAGASHFPLTPGLPFGASGSADGGAPFLMPDAIPVPGAFDEGMDDANGGESPHSDGYEEVQTVEEANHPDLLTAMPKRKPGVRPRSENVIGWDFEQVKDTIIETEGGLQGKIIGGEVHPEGGARLLVKPDNDEAVQTVGLDQFEQMALRAGNDYDEVQAKLIALKAEVTPPRAFSKGRRRQQV